MTAGRRWFLVVAVAGIGIAGFFLVRSASGDAIYFLYPHEAIERRADFPDGRVFNLAGTIVAGSVELDGDTTTFQMTDDLETVTVVLTAPTPPLFQEGVEVLVEGAVESGEFHSDNHPVIRHSAEYEAPDEGNAPAAGES